jgi:hypothetical protein
VSGAGPPSQDLEGGTGWYVYGVVPAEEGATEVFSGIRGVNPDAPVVLVVDGEIAAVASRVPLSEFGEGVIDRQLERPEWLGEKVREHESVLEAALARMPVVPFRFGTIYRGEEQVRQMLRDHASLAAMLEDVRGTVEFGVKGFLDPDRFNATVSGAPADDLSSGRAYLLRKQFDRRLEEARAAFRASCATESFERLAAVARESRLLRLQHPEVSGYSGEMFVNGAYLVETADDDAFRQAVADLEAAHGAKGVEYRLTGPWPPYNFVEAKEEA